MCLTRASFSRLVLQSVATHACRPAIFTGRPDRLLFYLEFFAFRATTTCMSASHFHRSAGPSTILLFHFHWVPGQRFLNLGPQNPHAGPPLSPVTISFPLGFRKWDFASRTAKPACRPTILTGRPECLLHFTILLFHFHWVPSRRFLHLGPQHLHVAPPFSPGGRTVYYFTWSFLHLGPQLLACRPVIFTCRPDRLLFYYFISIGFQAGGFYISGRKTCMSARHFAPGGRTVCYVTILLFHFHWVAGRRFLHLGPQKPSCRPAIFTGRPDRLLFYHVTISFPLGSRQEVFASRAAKPAGRPAISTGRQDGLLFYFFKPFDFH